METNDKAGERNKRSLLLTRTRPRTSRCSTFSCCLSAAFSASSRLLDLKCEVTSLKKKTISAAIVAEVKRFCHLSIRTRFSVHTGAPQALSHSHNDSLWNAKMWAAE